MSASVDCAVRVKSQDTMSGKTAAKAGCDGSALLPDFSESLDALSVTAPGGSVPAKDAVPDAGREQGTPEGDAREMQSPSELLDVLTSSESGDASLSGTPDQLSSPLDEEISRKDDEDGEDAPEMEEHAVPDDMSPADPGISAAAAEFLPAAAPAEIGPVTEAAAANGSPEGASSGMNDSESRTPDAEYRAAYSGISRDKDPAAAGEENDAARETAENTEDLSGLHSSVAADSSGTDSDNAAQAGAAGNQSGKASEMNFPAAGAAMNQAAVMAADDSVPSAEASGINEDSVLSAGESPSSAAAGAAGSLYTLLRREFVAGPGAAAAPDRPQAAASGGTGESATADSGAEPDSGNSGEQAEGEGGSGETHENRQGADSLLSGSSLRDSGLFSRIFEGGSAQSAAAVHSSGISPADGPGQGAFQAAAQVRSAPLGEAPQNPMDVLSRPLLMTDPSARGSGMFERVSAMIGRNLSDADIHLSPEGMGRLHIHLEMKDRTHAKVAIIAERQDTAQLLQDTMPKLRESLQSSGISLDSSSQAGADAGNSSFSRSGQDMRDRSGAFRSTFRMQGTGSLRGSAGDEADLSGASPEIGISSGRSGVDYYA